MHPSIRALVFVCLTLLSTRAVAEQKATISGLILTAGDAGRLTVVVTATADNEESKLTVEYGRTIAYGQKATGKVPEGAVDQTITVELTGLVGAQEYFVKVVGKNELTGTRVTKVYPPKLTLKPATHAGGKVTAHGVVTTNGTLGVVYFKYGTTASLDKQTTAMAVAANDIEREFSEELPLAANTAYSHSFVFAATAEALSTNQSEVRPTNIAPVVADLRVVLPLSGSITIDALASVAPDPEGDTVSISRTPTATNGTVEVVGGKLVFRRSDSYAGNGAIAFKVQDGFGGADSATITIVSAPSAAAGTHGGLLKDADGKEIGYFQITAQKSGAFSGTITVGGERRAFSGTLSPEGKYAGSVAIDGVSIPVAITATLGATETTIAADFGNGFWTADTVARPTDATERTARAGRYTLEFAGGTSTGAAANDGAQPDGSGWAAVRLLEDGMARIKGRLSDGRGFSTSGLLGFEDGKTVVTFFDDPRDTRLSGTLTLGTTVTGKLHAVREPSGRGDFAAGYDITSTATGERYVPPKDGQRAIEAGGDAKGRLLNVSISGGGLSKTISVDVRLTDNDKVRVLNPGTEDLSLKFDGKSGRFTVKVTGDTENQRIKGTGVLIQPGTGLARGSGVFTSGGLPGKVVITPGSGTGTPAPRPTPAPTTPAPQVVIQ